MADSEGIHQGHPSFDPADTMQRPARIARLNQPDAIDFDVRLDPGVI